MKILLIGEEHVRVKVARHYAWLHERRGVDTYYFIDDRSGITRKTTEPLYPLRARYTVNPRQGAGAVPRYWRDFVRYFHEVKPDLLEVYTAIHPVVLLPMALYARMHGVPVVVICRGELYPAEFDRQPWIHRSTLVRMLRMADLVVYKEPYMPAQLDRLAPRVERFAWTNAIPVHPARPMEREGNDVLFLNFFKPWRNLDLVVRAAPLVRARVPDVRFHLVGGSGEFAGKSGFYDELHDVEQGIVRLIDELGVGGFVRIYPFSAQVEEHFARARVFLLTADQIYCNYALLEAMEHSVPPVVTGDRDPDTGEIVKDGVNGFVVPHDPAPLADAIVRLLEDEPLRRRMGRAARATVEARFNLARETDALVDRYESLAGRAPRPRPEAALGAPAAT